MQVASGEMNNTLCREALHFSRRVFPKIDVPQGWNSSKKAFLNIGIPQGWHPKVRKLV